MLSIQERNEQLAQLSQMIINGYITNKLDHIATIYINRYHYFNVFRRYNSVYNIVIEDNNFDVYLHQDHTVRTSLKNVLCLPESDANNMYTMSATSYKHNGPVPSLSDDLADMRWTEIQTKYQAVSINFGGIFESANSYTPPPPSSSIDIKEEVPSTPCNQMIPPLINPPNAPERPKYTNEEIAAANTLLSLSIPSVMNPFEVRESDGPTLSMRFSDIQNRTPKVMTYSIPVCFCEMDEDDDMSEDESEDESEDSIDENNYTVLRNGTMIPKVDIC